MTRALLLLAVPLVAAAASSSPIISGQGDWKYQFLPDRVVLPTAEVGNDQNGHGLCRDDDDGSFYFTFVPKAVNNDTQVLVKFSPDGKTATLLGEPGPAGLSGGVPHGLRIEKDADAGKKFLYHANNKQRLIKTDLAGAIVWDVDLSDWKTKYPQYWPILPTDAIVVPGTDILLVVDGYGSSWAHWFNKTTGAYIPGHSFGGPAGNSTSPLRFHTPHGINIDPRYPATTFAVSDRSNSRIVWIKADGTFVASYSTAAPAGMSLPCNVDTHDDSKTGLVAVVPSLGDAHMHNGAVGIYDKDSKLLSTIEVAQTIGDQGHQHPHDAIFLPNGDVIVCCWSGPGNPGQGPAKGTISYWQRLASAEKK